MNITLKTERATKLLDKTNEELISAVNSLMEERQLTDVEYIEDVKAIHKFILDYELGLADTTRVLHHGVPFLIYKQLYNALVDYNKPIAKNPICDDFDTYVAMKYVQTKISAANRGIVFTLTLAQMTRLLKRKKCHYTGILFNEIHSLSLDRVDNTLGYVQGNVVPCSKVVNRLKEHLTENKVVCETMTTKEIVKMMKSFINIMETKGES